MGFRQEVHAQGVGCGERYAFGNGDKRRKDKARGSSLRRCSKTAFRSWIEKCVRLYEAHGIFVRNPGHAMNRDIMASAKQSVATVSFPWAPWEVPGHLTSHRLSDSAQPSGEPILSFIVAMETIKSWEKFRLFQFCGGGITAPHKNCK